MEVMESCINTSTPAQATSAGAVSPTFPSLRPFEFATGNSSSMDVCYITFYTHPAAHAHLPLTHANASTSSVLWSIPRPTARMQLSHSHPLAEEFTMPAAGSSWITNLLKLLLVIDSTGLVLTLTFICFRVLKVQNFPSLCLPPAPPLHAHLDTSGMYPAGSMDATVLTSNDGAGRDIAIW